MGEITGIDAPKKPTYRLTLSDKDKREISERTKAIREFEQCEIDPIERAPKKTRIAAEQAFLFNTPDKAPRFNLTDENTPPQNAPNAPMKPTTRITDDFDPAVYTADRMENANQLVKHRIVEKLFH